MCNRPKNHANAAFRTAHRTYIRQILQARKMLKGLMSVTLTSSAKLNFGQNYIFPLKSWKKCKLRYLANQKFIKGPRDIRYVLQCSKKARVI